MKECIGFVQPRLAMAPLQSPAGGFVSGTKKKGRGKPMKVEKLNIKLTFVESILGSMPADPAVYTKYIAEKAPAEWLKDEEVEDAEKFADPDKNVTVFPQDSQGLFLYNYHLKGFVKEAGNTLKDQLKIKNLRSKIDNYVFIEPRKIYLTRPGGQIITEEDDILERPLRGKTMQGERITLVASERVRPPVEIEFEIQLLQHPEIRLDTLREILNYGMFKGIGQWRNGGWGKFKWIELGCVELPREEEEKPEPKAKTKNEKKSNKKTKEPNKAEELEIPEILVNKTIAVFGRLGEDVSDKVKILWHEGQGGWDINAKRNARNADAIAVLTSLCSHEVTREAKNLAKNLDIPIAFCRGTGIKSILQEVSSIIEQG